MKNEVIDLIPGLHPESSSLAPLQNLSNAHPKFQDDTYMSTTTINILNKLIMLYVFLSLSLLPSISATVCSQSGYINADVINLQIAEIRFTQI